MKPNNLILSGVGTRRACLSDAPACGLDLTHHSCIIHAPGAHPKQATNDRSSSLTPIVREECARCRDLSPRRDKIILSLITAPVPYRLSPLFSRGTGGAMRTPFFGEGNAPPTHKSGDRWPRSRSEIRSSDIFIYLSHGPARRCTSTDSTVVAGAASARARRRRRRTMSAAAAPRTGTPTPRYQVSPRIAPDSPQVCAAARAGATPAPSRPSRTPRGEYAV